MATTDVTTEPAAGYERRGHVGILTLKRPRALNAVNSALSAAAGAALEQAQSDAEVRYDYWGGPRLLREQRTGEWQARLK